MLFRQHVTFLKFGVVGTLGFIVDGGLLSGLVALGVNAYWARVISVPVAILVTWICNRWWTFGTTAKTNPIRQFAIYFSVQFWGALVNFVTYSIILWIAGIDQLTVALAFALGSAAGLSFNYIGSKRFVFSTTKETLEPMEARK